MQRNRYSRFKETKTWRLVWTFVHDPYTHKLPKLTKCLQYNTKTHDFEELKQTAYLLHASKSFGCFKLKNCRHSLRSSEFTWNSSEKTHFTPLCFALGAGVTLCHQQKPFKRVLALPRNFPFEFTQVRFVSSICSNLLQNDFSQSSTFKWN